MQIIRSKAGLYLVLVTATILLNGCRSADYQVIQSKESASECSSNEEESFADDSSQNDSTCDLSLSDTAVESVSIAESVITVYVCGAVNNSGVYELSGDSRIADAIEAAGGFSDDADAEYLNLAMKVSDGMKIQVPTISETAELNSSDEQTLDNGSDSLSSSDDNFVVTGDGTPVDTNSQTPQEASDNTQCIVNINTAGIEELCTLSGIGESRANAIIAYREENGPFLCIEDIKKVNGIKDKVFEQIKDRITV
ncbi:MAG: helix-hairpin-helix domain-containing protein [Butyrivibrio sp.]|uniref:helix-hairpin-helix domain-containing protein n=1 Tax=Butyrivibrio sp. TaxID=28121 RepID=UPI0025DC9599|nr:helix-hairpin-helix domain-containing protein [Butyrivibrio sp.]MCR5771287.1 helix-hairpin-helix domain-containing protein [Butyrivibrio sp.]